MFSTDQDSSSSEVNSPVLRLLSRQRPILSSAVFLPVTVFLLSLQFCSVLSILAYFGFSILASSLLCRVYVYVMVTLLQKLPNHPESDPLEVVRQLKFKIPQKSVESILNSIVPLVETSLARLQSILLFSSPTDSACCLVALYLLSTIGIMKCRIIPHGFNVLFQDLSSTC